MRLIEVASLSGSPRPPKFVEIFDSSPDPNADPNVEKHEYAILSHRWGSDEVTFQELTDHYAFWKYYYYNKEGYDKVWKFAEVARSYGIKWIWCDTCCIDKTNAAELTEAINSMFKWYRDSKFCFAYLADWDHTLPHFTTSVWFERCWTLQELIAPRKVIFYDAAWNIRGNKLDLADQISHRTRIDPSVLRGEYALDKFSIAQRMSWSAGRRAAKPEDEAYCLLGIFDVSMPMLYGEGRKAFVRLQEEIIQRNADQSIFVWSSQTPSNNLLASSPADFVQCDGVQQIPLHKKAFTLNNLGLEIKLELRQIRGNTYAGYLACENRTPDNAVSLLLECEPGTTYLRRIQSCLNHNIEQHSREVRKARKITILRKVPDRYLEIPVPLYGFQLGGSCKSLILINDYDSHKYWDVGKWQRDPRLTGFPSASPVFMIPEGESTSIATLLLFIGKKRLLLHLMYDFDFRPCCHVSRYTRSSGSIFTIRTSSDGDLSEQKMAWLDQDTGWTKNAKYMELDQQIHPYTDESAWAVKSLHRGGFTASIPKDFTRPYRDIEVSFSPHPRTGDWVFDLSHQQSVSAAGTSENPFWELGLPVVSGGDELEDVLTRYGLPGLDQVGGPTGSRRPESVAKRI